MKKIFMFATLMLTAILTAQTQTWTGTKTFGSALKFTNVLQNDANTRILSLDATGKPGWVDKVSVSEFQKFIDVVRNTSSVGFDNFLFGSTSLNNFSGTETKFYFNKLKGSFRAGFVEGNRWDDLNVGNKSTAFGDRTMASGESSTAFGTYNTASGYSSTATGRNTIASGSFSITTGEYTIASGAAAAAFGVYTTASGYGSTALGTLTKAVGDSSIALGNNAEANGYGSISMGLKTIASGIGSVAIGDNTMSQSLNEIVIGQYNRLATTFQPQGYNLKDFLFVIGNGLNLNNKKNALTILKNGNTCIGDSDPTEKLQVDGNIKLSGVLKMPNLLVYADNSQAAAAGLSVGIVYRTATGQIMIVY